MSYFSPIQLNTSENSSGSISRAPTTISSCICFSSVVPESGVIPWVCASLNRACSGVHPCFIAVAARGWCARRLGAPDNVQNDLENDPWIKDISKWVDDERQTGIEHHSPCNTVRFLGPNGSLRTTCSEQLELSYLHPSQVLPELLRRMYCWRRWF